MRMLVVTAHRGAECLSECLTSWMDSGLVRKVVVLDGYDGIIPAYQTAWFDFRKSVDIICYLHDDLLIKDRDWSVRVRHEFETDKEVGIVGFGGAVEHGSRDIYKAPYDYHQLGRSEFLSNMQDAEVHGKRFRGERDVAVLDGFSLIVRTELLDNAQGWPLLTPINYVGYDYWLCCMAHRFKYKIRLVGVSCHHLGGRTWVAKGYSKSDKCQKEFLDSHRYIYEEFKDVLPFRAC